MYVFAAQSVTTVRPWLPHMEEQVRSEAVTIPVIRNQLVATLEEALRLQRRLVEDARDDEIPVAELVTQVTVLERLDDQRDELLGQMRRIASADIRAARTSPPIREVVLEVLDELRWPQNAKFLEEYLWAKRQLQVGSRAFAPLRRDERRSWQRAPRIDKVYIVPVLNSDGSANPRWLSSSAWPLARRIVASPKTERLFDLQKIYSLAGRPGSTDAYTRSPRHPLDALLERYAAEVLGTEPPSATASANEISTWRMRVRDDAAHRIGEIRRDDEPHREEIAHQFTGLSVGTLLWGKDHDADSGQRKGKAQ